MIRREAEIVKYEARLAYMLLIPSFVILVVIAFYPLASVFVNSFTNKVFASAREADYIGFKNYGKLLSLTVKELPPVIDEGSGQPAVDRDSGKIIYERPVKILPREPRRYKEVLQFDFFGKRLVLGATDRAFVYAAFDTITFTVVSVIVEVILGLGIALVLNSRFKGRGLMRAVMLIPWAIPTAVSSRMWAWMFASTRVGFINVFLQMLGLGNGQVAFITSEAYQLWVMVAIDVWKTTPFMALLLLAGLQLIPQEMYEAGRVDGASKLRQFRSLTIPMLRPTIAIALVFRTLDALRVFDVFQIVLAQKRYSLASFIYYQLIDNQAMGYSSAASVIVFILIFLFALLYIKAIGGANSNE